MKCLNCGQENNSENMYCSGCGRKLPRLEKVCSNCNTINSSNSLYCKKCGCELSEANNILICEEKEVKRDNTFLAYQALSLLSIVVNFLSTTFTFNILGLIIGIASLKIVKKISDKKYKSIKVCAIIGIVFSILLIVIKLVFIVITIIQFLETGEAPEVPDYSYFF